MGYEADLKDYSHDFSFHIMKIRLLTSQSAAAKRTLFFKLSQRQQQETKIAQTVTLKGWPAPLSTAEAASVITPVVSVN